MEVVPAPSSFGRAYNLPRSMQWALFVAGLLWMLAARIAAEHAAAGFAGTLHFAALVPLLTEAFFLFLLLGGFTALQWIATRDGSVRMVNALPARPSSRREWLTGAALGWCMLLVAVIPMALTGSLHPEFWLEPRAWGLALLSVLAAAIGALATETAFRGYLFRSLMITTGPTAATLLMSFGFALLLSLRHGGTAISFLFAFVEGILFALAYHRTHALWMGWGLRFGWIVSTGLLFGLPVRGSLDYASLVATNTSGAGWITGGGFGPDGSLVGIVVLLAAMVVLYSVTRDYAWNYTHLPIIPGGYEVVVAPPAAHVAMEQQAAAATPLVQIAAITPAAPSTSQEIENHLRSRD